MTKQLRALRASVVLLSIAACADSAPRTTTEVRLHLEAEPPHLNPILGAELASRVVLGDVLEPLWEVDPEKDTLVPSLAVSWWRSPDDTDWLITLRRDAVWHDGRPFTAADVVYTYRLLQPNNLATVFAADFDDLELVEAKDDHVVRLHFKGFRVGRDRTVAMIPILPAHVLGGTKPADLAAHPASRAPVGTGPYRVDSWEPGRAITLRRVVPHRAAAKVDRVVYRVIPDRQQALAQLRAGQLDAVAQVPSSQIDSLAADARFALVPYDAPTLLAVTWNARGGALADPRVRRALTMLLDRDGVIREIYKGRARPISGPWPPGAPAYDPSIPPWPFDPAAARALLDEAGVARGALSVKITIPSESRVLDRILTIWSEDAKQAGVTIAPDPAPWSEVLRRGRAGSFDGLALSWTTGPEQDFYHHFHSSQTGADNWGGVSDPEIDRLVDEIRRCDDRGERIGLEHALHRRLHELQPATFVNADVRVGAVSRRLAGVRLGASGLPARLLSIAGGAR